MESAQAQDTSRAAELETQRAAGEELRAQAWPYYHAALLYS